MRCSGQRFSPIGSSRCRRIARDIGYSCRTLRSPTAGIGTELLARREKIEVTRSGSPFERSPVPVGRAHRPYTRELRASLRRIAGMPDSLAEGSEFELPVPVSKLSDDASGCSAFLSPSNVADRKADPAFEPRAIPTIRLGAANPDVLLSSECSQIGTGSSNSPGSANESSMLSILRRTARKCRVRES
jgi:hypothetical protein